MTETSRHDAWSAGQNYDQYMGRWSRRIATRFLTWLDPASGLDWLEIGCGTGALSSTILKQCDPGSVEGIDPSAGFIAAAKNTVPDPRAAFQVADAADLPFADSSKDIAVSALVLNFVPDKLQALVEMQRVLRPGGRIGFYVWDYPGGGVEFMQTFWDAAAALDPAAHELDEMRRFPDCTQKGLSELASSAGLLDVAWTKLEIDTTFASFDDFWHPFTLGAGPAPGYCMNLDAAARERLRDKLENTLPRAENGSIPLRARAWGVKALAT